MRYRAITRETATGAPVVQLCLPETIEELFLEYLPRLAESGLVLDGIGNVRGYRFMGCPGIDGFAMLERLHQAKLNGSGKLERFVLDIDMEDDGRLLGKYDYGTYTSTGAIDNRHSGLRGRLCLTKYMDDEQGVVIVSGIQTEVDITGSRHHRIGRRSLDECLNISRPDHGKFTVIDNDSRYACEYLYSDAGFHRIYTKVTKKPNRE